MRYRAFLSYSHRDKDWADWLHKALEGYRVPKALVGKAGRDGAIPARLFPVFRDREELPSASDLNSQISDALRESEYLIVICSPHAVGSRWVSEEILSYKRMGRENRILALIVDGEPNAGDKTETADQECFPDAMKFRLGADGALSAERNEPIAADARETGDGKENAKLKLVAGLLGVGFNDLKHRELEAAKQRLRIFQGIAAAMTVLALLAVTGGIVAYRYMLRSNEMTEASVKVVAGFTNELVSLREELPQRILDRFVVQIDQQLSGLFAHGVRTGSIDEQQAILLRLFADHYDASGDGKRELIAARRLVDATRRARDEHPDDPHVQSRFASAQLTLGRALAKDGQFVAALAAYRTGTSMAEDQLRQEPNSIARIADASYAWMAMSAVQNALGKTAAAIDALAKSARYTNDLVKRQPKNPAWQSDLSGLFRLEGELFLQHGRFKEALQAFRQTEFLMQRLAAHNPANLGLGEGIADAKVLQARALLQMGRSADSTAMYGQATAIYRQILQLDPRRAYSAQRLATVLLDLAQNESSQTATVRFARLQESEALYRRLLALTPNNIDIVQSLALVEETTGSAYFAQKNYPKALVAFEGFATQSEHLLGLDPSQPRWQYYLGRALTDGALTLSTMGRSKDALAKYDASIAALKNAARREPSNASVTESLRYATQARALLVKNGQR